MSSGSGATSPTLAMSLKIVPKSSSGYMWKRSTTLSPSSGNPAGVMSVSERSFSG